MAEASSGSPKKSSNNVLWIILGCLGCGGFGFLGLGILAAIALPSFLNQANKAIASEARTYVGAMNRGQQAYYLNNATFSSSIEALGVDISAETANYSYAMEVQPDGSSVVITAMPKDEFHYSFTGAVHVVGDDPATATTIAEVCESTTSELPAPPQFNSEIGSLECASGSSGL